MSSKGNNTITTRTKLASARTKAEIIPQTKVATGKLAKAVITKSSTQDKAKGVVVPGPSFPRPWDAKGEAKLSRR